MSSQPSQPVPATGITDLLLTGAPGCGKTTVLERVVEHLGDSRLAGFLTLELREHGHRVGFEAVGLGGRRVILAHVRFRSHICVGRYGVEPYRLSPLIEEELVRPPGSVDAFLIDEIGKMECHCPEFILAERAADRAGLRRRAHRASGRDWELHQGYVLAGRKPTPVKRFAGARVSRVEDRRTAGIS